MTREELVYVVAAGLGFIDMAEKGLTDISAHDQDQYVERAKIIVNRTFEREKECSAS